MGILEPFIFIFYLVFFCSFFYYFNVQKGTGLTISFIIFLFILKVAAGCFNLYVHYHEYLSNDIQFYHQQSLLELKGFQQHPRAFLYEWLFNWGDITHHLNFFKKENMPYWSDLGVLIHSKYMNLSNIFSLGGLYTNVIFFNLIYFTGLLQLYKTFYRLQPQKKWLFVGVIFFIPSVLFWCSGIHKDGWILASIGFICFYTMRYLDSKQWRYIACLIPFLILLFVVRYFVFLCFFPPFLLWFLFYKYPKRVFVFTGTYVFTLVVFFSLGYFTSIEPLEIIIAKQHDFFAFRGYSDMQTPLLQHRFSSFVANFPSACNHIFLRPYFNIHETMKYQFAALDTWFVFGVIVTLLCCIKRRNLNELFYLMLLFFSISMYLFIGYVLPNCGALVRYKSEFTALLLPALAALSEVPFLKKFYVAG